MLQQTATQPLSRGRFKASAKSVVRRSPAHRIFLISTAKTADEQQLRMDISSLVSESGDLLALLGTVNNSVATLKKQIEASDQLLRYVFSQIAAVSDDLKLVISLGKTVFEPDYLPFLQANEKLMQKQTDALSGLFKTYFTVLEAPQQ